MVRTHRRKRLIPRSATDKGWKVEMPGFWSRKYDPQFEGNVYKDPAGRWNWELIIYDDPALTGLRGPAAYGHPGIRVMEKGRAATSDDAKREANRAWTRVEMHLRGF